MSSKKRVLISGDGIFTPSGFGTITRNLVLGLSKDPDIEIACHSWQHMGNKMVWEGITIYPNWGHPMGADALPWIIDDFRPDIIITEGDLWMANYLAEEDFQQMLKRKKIKWFWYVPIDTEMLPPAFRPIMKVPEKVISMAYFASEVMKVNNIENWFVPHGVNTEVFKPLSVEKKQEIKKSMKYIDKDLSGKFVVGFVGRNQDRKQIPRLIKAFAMFAKDKDDVHLHLHMDKFDPAGMSKDFRGRAFPGVINLTEYLGITNKVGFTKGVVHFTNSLTFEELNEVYNMFDVHASTTSGEGFGLTTLESLSAGIPNIITDYTSSKELIRDHGELVPAVTFLWGSFGTWRAIVNEEEFAGRLQKLYDDWKGEGKLISDYSIRSRQHALNYDWTQKIIPMWKEVIMEE